MVLTRVDGHFSVELANAFMKAIDRQAASVGTYGVHDWREMSGFDVTIPPRLAAWTLGIRPRPSRVVIATNAPLVMMAIRTVNITVKMVELVSDEAAISAAVEAALRDGASGAPGLRS
ncbi:MAG: hypothetical protein H5U40_03720 [Polyangiaceae bacterium]|nr:hypothetical protein [Polyangiaceae bacterium]